MSNVTYQSSVTKQDLETIWNASDAAASEAAYRKLLLEAAALEGTEQGFHVEVLTLIARSECAQDKLADAQLSLDAAEKILKQPDSSFPATATLRWTLESARLQVSRRTPSQARHLLSQAWELSLSSGDDFFTVDVAQTMALIEPPKGREEWLRRALDVAEKSPNARTKKWLGPLYSSLAAKLLELRQLDRSLEMFRKSLEAFEQQHQARESFLTNFALARTLRIAGRFAEALSIQEELWAKKRLAPELDGRILEEIAECLYSLKRLEDAQGYFARAYEELSRKDRTDDGQPLKLKRLKELGKVQ